ncbi:MAG: 3-deoxy-8-phosphooctulonate synthase [Bacteroidales bacterium]
MKSEYPLLMQKPANRFFLIAGPCVIENETTPFEIALTLKEIATDLNIPLIFKASYKKANRTSLKSFTGIGDHKALAILSQVRSETGLPVITDVHTAEEAALAARYADILQIPAFLSRQTELLLAAGKTGKPVNIKKGQFLHPEVMKFAVEKVYSTGNKEVWLTERGSQYGYQDLIVDFRSIPVMQKTGCPVILDCTHSLQQPNQSLGVTGGLPELIETIASAGVAAGVDGLFFETHPEPEKALSDGANMLPIQKMRPLLEKLVRIKEAVS